MTVKAIMPVRQMNLVTPLAHKATATHTTETAAKPQARSSAVAPLIGCTSSPRRGDVDSVIERPTQTATSGPRTSTTVTRTTSTRTTSSWLLPSADSHNHRHLKDYAFADLVQAWLDCRRTKCNTACALAFEERLEANLLALHDDLCSQQYRPGRSICFVIDQPKPREVWAADFRDRVVHHLLYNAVAPRIEARFIATSCACIQGRGTLYAARQLEHMVRSATHNWQVPAHYLKIDLANFFVAIDKTILLAQLQGHIRHPWWQALASTILLHDQRTDYELRGNPALLHLVPAHKRLANAPAHCGLPIGNLSSQFFANVYLNGLDQHVKHQLRAPHYVRYVDDAVLVHTSAPWLQQTLAHLTQWLPEQLHAHINPRKTVLQPVERGIDFVGHVIKPWRRTTRPRTVRRAVQRLATMPASETFAAGNSYLGLIGQATHSHHDRTLIANVLRDRGHAVKGDSSWPTDPQVFWHGSIFQTDARTNDASRSRCYDL